MNPSVKLFRELLAVLILAGLTACRSASVIPTPTPTAQSPAPSALPTTTRPAATSTSFQTPTQDHNRVAATIPLSSPSSMAVGDGFIWVISGGSVVRIDPKTNQIVGKPIPAGVQFESDIAFGEGALWVTIVGPGDLGSPNDIDAVSRIDPETGETVATIKVSRGPVSLAITPGTVWVVNFGMNGDTVTQIDAKTNQITGEPIQTGRAPLSMTIGDGSVWVAIHDAGTVTRIDPKTNQLVGEPIEIGFHAGNIVAGLGSVWVTSDYRVDGDPGDEVIVRIDPQTNQVVETIPVGGHPIDVAVTEDAVWVSVQNPDMVLRINP